MKELTLLNSRQLAYFWELYLPIVARSIKVDIGNSTDPKNSTDPEDFIKAPGFFKPLQSGMSWKDRQSNWYRGGACAYLPHIDTTPFLSAEQALSKANTHSRMIPLFRNYVKQVLVLVAQNKQLTQTQTQTQTQEQNLMKDTMNKLAKKNKNAVSIAARLTTGKTANTFMLSKLLGSFPWYTKLFSKKHDIKNNPVAKIVAAETAMALVTHFAPDNAKLNYIAESMVEDAIVDVTVNSEMLEKILAELDTLIKLPDFTSGK